MYNIASQCLIRPERTDRFLQEENVSGRQGVPLSCAFQERCRVVWRILKIGGGGAKKCLPAARRRWRHAKAPAWDDIPSRGFGVTGKRGKPPCPFMRSGYTYSVAGRETAACLPDAFCFTPARAGKPTAPVVTAPSMSGKALRKLKKPFTELHPVPGPYGTRRRDASSEIRAPTGSFLSFSGGPP